MNIFDTITNAYDALAEEDMDWIRIARIQTATKAPIADIHAALLDLAKAGIAHLAPESATKVLKAEDHAAAVRQGSEDLHLVAIDPAYWGL